MSSSEYSATYSANIHKDTMFAKKSKADKNYVYHMKLARVCSGPFVHWQTVRENVEKTKWFVEDKELSKHDIKPSPTQSASSHDDMLTKAFGILPHLQDIIELPNYRLISFEGPKGKAELIRILLAVADVPYEDCKVTKEEWEEMKEELPYDTLPLFATDDHFCGDISAVVKTLAQIFRLTGVTNKDYLVTEATYERLSRLQNAHSEAINLIVRGSNNKEKMEWAQYQLSHVVLPVAFNEWEPLIKLSPGPFITENGMTLADLAIMDFVDQCSSNLVIAPILADFPAVSDLITMVRRHSRIYAYLEERAKNSNS